MASMAAGRSPLMPTVLPARSASEPMVPAGTTRPDTAVWPSWEKAIMLVPPLTLSRTSSPERGGHRELGGTGRQRGGVAGREAGLELDVQAHLVGNSPRLWPPPPRRSPPRRRSRSRSSRSASRPPGWPRTAPGCRWRAGRRALWPSRAPARASPPARAPPGPRWSGRACRAGPGPRWSGRASLRRRPWWSSRRLRTPLPPGRRSGGRRPA